MTKLTKKIPQNSGVYFFKDGKRRIIYIGKAANLKTRISSYFQKRLESRIAKMVESASGVYFKKTESAIDALILEAALIKKYSPKYNVLMRDGKNYFFVGFTADEFPKIFLTHQISETKRYPLNAKRSFIGPFTDGGALKNVLRSLRKPFPYCSCSGGHNRPCLRAHLKRCAGVCCLKKEFLPEFYPAGEVAKIAKNYRAGIILIKKVLLGERKGILKKLKKEMRTAAKKQDFEKAAETRDKIFALENIFAHRAAVSDFVKSRENLEEERAKIAADFKKFFGVSFTWKRDVQVGVLPSDFKGRIEIYDISNISGKFAVGAMVVFENGKPAPFAYRRFKIKGEQEPNDPKMMKEMFERRLRRTDWPAPDLMVIDGGAGQLSAVAAAVRNVLGVKGRKIPIIALAKGKEEIYRFGAPKISLFAVSEPTRLFLERMRDEAHRFAVKYHRKIRARAVKNG